MNEELKQTLDCLTKIDDRISQIQEGVKKSEIDLKSAQEKIDEMGKAQVKFSKQLIDLQQRDQKVAGMPAALSVGAQFVKSDSYKSFLTNHRSASFVFANKSDDSGSDGDIGAPITSEAASLLPRRIPGVLGLEEREFVIEGLFPHIAISENSVEYLKEKAFTNNAAPVSEAATKPYSTLEFETAQTPVQVIAHWTKITRQLADDAPALRAFINARMIYGVNLACEDQILSGNGTSPNLSGLMKSGNFTEQSFSLQELGGAGATLLDLLRMSFATVNANGYRTSAVILNPLDWAALQGLKETNGQYLLGSPANSYANSTVWGVRVVTSAAMTQGAYLAGDFARAATIYDRMQTVIDLATQNEDDFIHNVYTIRAERRLALAVERPAALIGGNLVVAEESGS